MLQVFGTDPPRHEVVILVLVLVAIFLVATAIAIWTTREEK